MVGKVITDDERAAILKRCRWPGDHNHPSVAMHLRHLIGLKVINPAMPFRFLRCISRACTEYSRINH